MTESKQVEGSTASGAGQACSCCSPAAPADQVVATEGETVTSSYDVAGMTCSHCVASVTEELTALGGVRSVEVDLRVGGASRVTVVSAAPLEEAAVAEAVSEAGYQLAGK